MSEQTDWYERGCSRSCRNEHTNVWGWCDLAEEPAPTLNLSIAETFTASDGNTSVKIRPATVEEAEAELAKFRPAPTWRDVIRAMREAGWTGRGGRWRMWGSRSSEDVNDQHGWVIRHQFLRTVKFTVVGPGTGHLTDRSYTELINPTPAKVLDAARLVGLGGNE